MSAEHRYSWFLKVPHGSSWFLMVPHGSSWFLMVPHGSSWFLVPPVDHTGRPLADGAVLEVLARLEAPAAEG